ncbi:MAG: quinolinate synthase NadA [bacterium]
MDEIQQIKELKEKQGAIILAHTYQLPQVQEIADFVGDSLELAKFAAKTDAKIIVLGGVKFMAETAAVIAPEKKILLPDFSAGCPMADMINAKEVRELKLKHPKAKVVCYVNSTSEVKAESDITCTSSNAKEIIDKLDCEEIIFIPDKYLGEWVARNSNKKFIFHNGYCPVHQKIMPEKILELKNAHPKAIAMCHPECNEKVKAVCDYVLSTGQMIKMARESAITEFIIATEIGIMHQLKKQNYNKKFYHISPEIICEDMKKITLEKILLALKNPEKHRVAVPENIARAARSSIGRMMNL